MDYCTHFMHGICMFNAWMCMFHAWNLAHIMHEMCMFYASHIPCVVQAYSMHGTDVFHAWYRCIPCMLQAYSVHGTGIRMHVPCTVQVYSRQHTCRFCSCIVVKSKGKYNGTSLIHTSTIQLLGLSGIVTCRNQINAHQNSN